MSREMKDSGIEWIGEIPREWETARLKTLFSFGKGLPITKENLCEFGVPVISYGQIHSKTNTGVKVQKDLIRYVSESYLETNEQSLVNESDFIFADTSEDIDGCGNCVYVDSQSVLFAGYHTIILHSRKNRNNRYLAYLFKTDNWRSQIRGRVSGVKVFSISRKILSDAAVLLPPVSEQQTIADFLDNQCSHIDSVIEKTHAAIEEYKKLKQFVITQAVTKGIRPNRDMKDSGIEWIGEIPKEWSLIRIKWLLKERNERSVSGNEEPLSMSQKYGLIPTSQMDMIPNMASSFVGAKLCYKNDLVFNKLKAHLGVFAVSNFDGLVSPDYAVYYSTNIASLKYLEYLFKTPQYIGEFRKKSTGVGAGLTRLYTSGLYSIYCALPDFLEQTEIVTYIDEKTAAIDSLIKKKEQLITELESYKKSLIYEYVTGKKEVKADITVEYSPEFKKALLMCRILELTQCKGRIHLQKTFFAIDTLLNLFSTQYYRFEHGPYDLDIESYEKIIEENGWLNIYVGKSIKYNKTNTFSDYFREYEKVFGDRDDIIQRICKVFNVPRTTKAEKIATLLAVWNDFLINGIEPTDDMIIDDVITNWTPNKANVSRETWSEFISKIRENNIVPKGYGKHTKRMEELVNGKKL